MLVSQKIYSYEKLRVFKKFKTMAEMKRMCRDREILDEMDGERRTRRSIAEGVEMNNTNNNKWSKDH